MVASGLVVSSLILGAVGVFAFPGLGELFGIPSGTLSKIIDQTTGKISLLALPQGHGEGIDADKLDGLHGDAFARAQDLDKLATTVGGLQVTLTALEASSSQTASSGVTTLNNLSGPLKLVGGTGVTISQSGNTFTFQTAPSGSPTGVTSLTGGGGITVSGSTGAVTLGTSAIQYSALSLSGSISNADISGSAGIYYGKLALSGSIVGGDLAGSIIISTSGNISTTGSGTITSTGLLTAGNGLTISGGNLTVSGTAIFNNSGAATTKTNIDSAGNILPGANNSGTLGSAGLYWNNVFTNTLTANSISATTSAIAGTTSATFTVNTDNLTNDTEDMDLIFFRGTASPNALLSWKSALDRFELNFPLSISGSLSATGATLSGLSTAGVVHNSAAGVLSTSLVSLTADVSGILPLVNGGTGSSTQNFVDLTSAQTVGGAKTFSSALTAPTATNTINGLVISSGALSGITTLNLTGSITGATSTNTINGLVFSSGNATLANLTSSSGALTSTVADGASAVGFILNTSTTYSTSGAKLLSLKNNTVEEFAIDKDGNLTVNGNIVATGNISGTQLISTVLTGTAPLVVSSTTQVANLNASFIEGYNAATLMSQPQPNLILNSDFGRRNKWMTLMPEVFSDTSGQTLGEGASLGSVTSNILTAGNTGVWAAASGLSTWRDFRASALVQFNDTSVAYASLGLAKWIDSGNWVGVSFRNTDGYINLGKKVGGGAVTEVQPGPVAGAPTLNNWYWLEIEFQGTTVIGKAYSCGASPCAKSSATLLGTVVGTVSDSALVAGRVAVKNGLYGNPLPVAMKVGGLSTGDGGVYVEGWGPEGWNASYFGTKGGQSIGWNEATDSGPIGKQWSFRAYIPAATRGIDLYRGQGTDMPIEPSTSYVLSGYVKTTGLGGTGPILNYYTSGLNGTGGFNSNLTLRFSDAGETAWTRKTASFATGASDKYLQHDIGINQTFNAAGGDAGRGSATGTIEFTLLQLERGGVATPWRNAPADDGPIVWELEMASSDKSVAGQGAIELESRDLGINVFLPWDARVAVEVTASTTSTSASAQHILGATIDGSTARTNPAYTRTQVPANTITTLYGKQTKALASGKHRTAMTVNTDGGVTMTVKSNPTSSVYDQMSPRMILVATRGK